MKTHTRIRVDDINTIKKERNLQLKASVAFEEKMSNIHEENFWNAVILLKLLYFQVQVAIKCLTKEKMHTGTTEFLKEANIMQNVDHENIVRMYGVVLDKDDSLMLVGTKICCLYPV